MLDKSTIEKHGSSPAGKTCWLTDTQNIAVPPMKSDFAMVGNLQKRRGGFGKIAQNNWKNRCFVLLRSGNLCYFEAGLFEKVDFCSSPRGILTLDGDVSITKQRKPDGDGTGPVITIQGGAQRWRLCSEKVGEIDRWEQVSLQQGTVNSSHYTPESLFISSCPHQPLTQALRDMIAREVTPNTKREGTKRAGFSPVPSNQSLSLPPQVDLDVEKNGRGEGTHFDLYWFHGSFFLCKESPAFLLFKRNLFATLFLANLVVGSRILKYARPRSECKEEGVPLVHSGDVSTLKATMKRCFPAKKRGPSSPRATVGEVSCGVPNASTTMPYYDGSSKGVTPPPHTWSRSNGSVFRLRGKQYMQDRVKTQSGVPLYDLAGVDLFATEARVGHMAAEVFLDQIMMDLPVPPFEAVPPILVVNVQLPSAPPALMSSAEDGPGIQCVFYFRISEATNQALHNLETASEAVKLWKYYCEGALVDDSVKGRFKCVCVIGNSEGLGIPGFILKYNGKPVLINRSGTWFRGEKDMEYDINVHKFSFVAKKGLHALKELFKDMILHVGFTIEGKSADELPENLLACGTLNYPRLDKAVEFDVSD
ncbi:unnamed protein product [Discosporangium mesarthrocarpum]